MGREIDGSFIEQLPNNVDPCGENGEYHTFCYEGKIFKNKIDFSIGDKIYKSIEVKKSDDSICTSNTVTKEFWFIDLLDV